MKDHRRAKTESERENKTPNDRIDLDDKLAVGSFSLDSSDSINQDRSYCFSQNQIDDRIGEISKGFHLASV
jgi:hypothetical protein